MISLDEFLRKWKNASLRDGLLEAHVKKERIPLVEKLDYVNKIITESHYSAKGGKFRLNSGMLYILTGLALVDLFTDIEIPEGNEVEVFDELQANGLLDALMTVVEDDDWNQFRMFLDMADRDVIYNELKIIENE